MSTSIARQVRQDVERVAAATLANSDPERAREAAARVANAFYASVSAAKNPSAWANVSSQSVRAAVANSIATDLYPGGAMPTVYLVPQSGHLDWRITHRGLTELCRREGYEVRAVPVGLSDHLRVEAGLVVEHEQDPDAWPEGLADLRGVMVAVRRVNETHTERHWVPRVVIEKRRKVSRMSDKGPWRDWPVEMAQKTAILYLGQRGSLPISTSMAKAMEAEVIEVVRDTPRPQPRALPLEPEVVKAEAEEAADGE